MGTRRSFEDRLAVMRAADADERRQAAEKQSTAVARERERVSEVSRRAHERAPELAEAISALRSRANASIAFLSAQNDSYVLLTHGPVTLCMQNGYDPSVIIGPVDYHFGGTKPSPSRREIKRLQKGWRTPSPYGWFLKLGNAHSASVIIPLNGDARTAQGMPLHKLAREGVVRFTVPYTDDKVRCYAEVEHHADATFRETTQVIAEHLVSAHGAGYRG